MTPPQIILTLHGAGEKYCGDCKLKRRPDLGQYRYLCRAFGQQVIPFDNYMPGQLMRLPDCLAAEAELRPSNYGEKTCT